ncbi:MAG: dihydrodipicolinate synthase family protein [Desulfobacteraceae bacterium]|nr:MAG: dihydrodipicolinate synthase family protein [Desulfobacteraceae bacterium]
MAKKQIKGVIPPMLTPFKANGDVDYDRHIRNMERWNKDRLAGYLVLGSNSETAYMNEAEKIKLIRLTVKHAKKGRFILAGTGVESARETIALTNKAADLGVDAALILTPSYYHSKMNEEAQIRFFTEVADKTKIPVMIYNVTAFTHINVTVNTVRVLSRHPNILGMKDSTGNVPQLTSFLSVIDKGFNLMTGTLSAWYPALTLGIKAGIFAVANCAPNECSAIQTVFDKGDHEAARKLYFRIFPVNNAVTATFGIPGLKYASDLMGYRGGHVRSPLLPLKDEEKIKIKEILQTAELI